MPIPLPLPRPAAPAPPPAALGLTSRMRERLTSDLHMGKLHPGDRLPSIRQVARESGVDHRAVAHSYRELADEGLVEIHGRSGVRVAQRGVAESGGRSTAAAPDGWVAEVLASSWLRAVPSGDLQRLLRACLDASRLRCACVESNRDQMVAYCTEIGELSGMSMVPVYIPPREPDAAALAALRRELEEVDLVVTTQYHAAVVKAALVRRKTPLVLLSVSPQLASAVRERLRKHGITVIAATREFGERLRLMYGDVITSENQLRVVQASDAAALRRLSPAEPVLLTRAARELLQEPHAVLLVFPQSPTIAAESVRELTGQMVRLVLNGIGNGQERQ